MTNSELPELPEVPKPADSAVKTIVANVLGVEPASIFKFSEAVYVEKVANELVDEALKEPIARLHICERPIFADRNQRCDCPWYVNKSQADELVKNGKASWRAWSQIIHGKMTVCTSRKDLESHLSDEERRDIEHAAEIEERQAWYEQRAAERLEVFQGKERLILRDTRKMFLRYKIYSISQTLDEEIVAALEDEAGVMKGLCVENRVTTFHPLMSRQWLAILDRDNLSMERGEKPVGGTYRFSTGTEKNMSVTERMDAADWYIVDADGNRLFGDGRVTPAGAGPDTESGPWNYRRDGGKSSKT